MKAVLQFLCLLGAVVIIGTALSDHSEPGVCTDESKVKAILSIDYRDATILLEDGRKLRVNQASLKPGDTYCVSRKGRAQAEKTQGQ